MMLANNYHFSLRWPDRVNFVGVLYSTSELLIKFEKRKGNSEEEREFVVILIVVLNV